MAKTAADYQVLIDLLDDAIGRGVKSVTIDGMRTDYASTDDMIKAQSWMRAGKPRSIRRRPRATPSNT